MAPFGFHRPVFGKKKHQPSHETIIEEPQSAVSGTYTLGNDYGSQQLHMTTQAPAKAPSRWKSVLKKKPQPQVIDSIIPLHDRQFLDNDDHPHAYTVSGPHMTPAPTELPPPPGGSSVRGYDRSHGGHHGHHPQRSQSSSGSSSSSGGGRRTGGRGVARHNTGRSHAHTIEPRDSASNVHVYEQYHPQPTGHILQGIVEEQSDAAYSHRSGSPVITPIGMVAGGPTFVQTGGFEHEGEFTTHAIGRGMHLHHGARREGQRLAPLQVTDAHGRRQNVQEIMLDGSGVQEIPMPADGNVIFIVEEGVTLDVKDPETGEYIPLEEYYTRLAQRTPPKPQERYIVVNGDASNIIVEDAEGQILHRGERVKSEFIRNRGLNRSNSHTGSERSHGSGRSEQYSQHVRHDGGPVVYH